MLYNKYNMQSRGLGIMERKLVKQGRNALTVTLPAKWLQERGLQAGNSVFIEGRNRDLVISTALRAGKTAVVIDASQDERNIIWHKVHARYLEGYDEITIHHSNPKAVQEIADELIGMIIEEHTSTKTILRNLIVVPEENFDLVLRRAGFQLLQVAKTLEQAAAGQANVDDVKAQERLLDSNILYCIRYLNKYETTKHAYRYFLICATMEEAGDAIKNISHHIGKDAALAKLIVDGIAQYNTFLFKQDFRKLYGALRASRSQIRQKTFAQGLAFALFETLYNFIGYVVEQR